MNCTVRQRVAETLRCWGAVLSGWGDQSDLTSYRRSSVRVLSGSPGCRGQLWSLSKTDFSFGANTTSSREPSETLSQASGKVCPTPPGLTLSPLWFLWGVGVRLRSLAGTWVISREHLEDPFQFTLFRASHEAKVTPSPHSGLPTTLWGRHSQPRLTEEEAAVSGHRHDLPSPTGVKQRSGASSPAFSMVLQKCLGSDRPEFRGSWVSDEDAWT